MIHPIYTAENIFLALLHYKNWPDVIRAIVKRQDFTKVILRRSGLQIESAEGLKHLMNEIFLKKVYCPAHLKIEPNDIVVDIGAHYGIFSLFAASHTRNIIIAFEPSPRNFAILERNIRANKLENVVLQNAAVADKNGAATLFQNPVNNTGHLLSDYLLPEKLQDYRTNISYKFEPLVPDPDKLGNYAECEVLTTTLQAIMDSNGFDRIDFLKVDCEGAEGAILASTSKPYLKRIKKIAMEFHDYLSDFDHYDIQKLLEEAGFRTKLRWDRKAPLGYLYGWRE